MRVRGFLLATMIALAAAQPAAAQLIQIDTIIAISPNEGGSTPAPAFPDNRMAVPVTIGGSGPYPFVIDTAAERSVVASEIADALGLDVVGQSRLLSMNNTRPVDHVRAPSVRFGATTRDLQAFSVTAEHIGAAGVLGIDALQGQRVVLDFGANTISVEPATARPDTAPGEIVVRGRERLGQLVLAGANVRGVDVDIIVDSGLDVSLGNELLRSLLRPQREQPIGLRGATGEAIAARYAIVDDFRIGGVRLSNTPMAFADAYIFQRLSLNRRPALLLGMETLRLFDRVTVDFANHQASFVLAERRS